MRARTQTEHIFVAINKKHTVCVACMIPNRKNGLFI